MQPITGHLLLLTLELCSRLRTSVGRINKPSIIVALAGISSYIVDLINTHYLDPDRVVK
jgi:hypothetical protein